MKTLNRLSNFHDIKQLYHILMHYDEIFVTIVKPSW